jgi:hypothetical protein
MTDGAYSSYYGKIITAAFDPSGNHIGLLGFGKDGQAAAVFAIDDAAQDTWTGGATTQLVPAKINGSEGWVYVRADTNAPLEVDASGRVPLNEIQMRLTNGKKPGKSYKTIGHVVLSTDRAHFIYPARKVDDSWVLVQDGRELDLGPDSRKEPVTIALSGDGSKAFWVVDRGQDGMALLRDGSVVGLHKRIGLLAVSRDANSYAYTASDRDGVWQVIVGSKPLAPFDGVDGLVMSPDGAHVAYLAIKGESEVFVGDGNRSREFAGHMPGTDIVVAGGVFRALGVNNKPGGQELIRVEWYP